MERTNGPIDSSEDSFVGFPPQPIKCEWLTARDEKLAPSADIIRLIVDDQRGHCGPWANDIFQKHFLHDIEQFIGPTRALLMTDAGSIKVKVSPLSATLDSLQTGLKEISQALSRTDLGSMEMLLGVDGCIPGQSTHLQAVVHLKGKPTVALANTTIKIYPTGAEASLLVGWRVCSNLDGVPDEFVKSRRVKTTVGTILVLVCNDAAIFSARSRSNLGSKLGLAIREHFLKQASISPAPNYLLMATHWQGINPDTGRWSGEAFRQAADFLANETGATVVTTLRAPKSELVAAANRFRVVGSREDKVATLLVSDTL